jgi:hypothetical protein
MSLLDECLDGHLARTERRVDEQVDGIRCLSRVVVVDGDSDGCDLEASRPPANNHLRWVDLLVQFIHRVRYVHLD